VWWPKKSCKLSLKYEINNENNFAVVATFGKEVVTKCYRWRKKVDKFCWKRCSAKNGTVRLILLQSGVKLTNWRFHHAGVSMKKIKISMKKIKVNMKN